MGAETVLPGAGFALRELPSVLLWFGKVGCVLGYFFGETGTLVYFGDSTLPAPAPRFQEVLRHLGHTSCLQARERPALALAAFMGRGSRPAA